MSIVQAALTACIVAGFVLPGACARIERGRTPQSDRTESSRPAEPSQNPDEPLSPNGSPLTLRVGVQGSPTLSQVRALGSEAVRLMLKSQQLARSARRGEDSVARLRELKAAGVEVIACVRWPASDVTARETVDAGGRRQDAHTDAVPRGREREEALQLVERFLIATKGSLDWYQLGNEVLSGPGRYSEQDWRSGDAVEWLTALATRAREVIKRENLSVKLISPGLHGVSSDLAGDAGTGTDMLLKFAGKHCDAIDVHLHVNGYDDLVKSVEALKERMKRLDVDLPLMALEWSMSGATRDWFARDRSRREFVQGAYERPLDAGAWEDFVESGPYPRDFMRRSYRYLNSEGFRIVCWAPMGQYRSPIFDVTALYAYNTVKGRQTPNEPFYSDFRRLTADLKRQRSK